MFMLHGLIFHNFFHSNFQFFPILKIHRNLNITGRRNYLYVTQARLVVRNYSLHSRLPVCIMVLRSHHQAPCNLFRKQGLDTFSIKSIKLIIKQEFDNPEGKNVQRFVKETQNLGHNRGA